MKKRNNISALFAFNFTLEKAELFYSKFAEPNTKRKRHFSFVKIGCAQKVKLKLTTGEEFYCRLSGATSKFYCPTHVKLKLGETVYTLIAYLSSAHCSIFSFSVQSNVSKNTPSVPLDLSSDSFQY